MTDPKQKLPATTTQPPAGEPSQPKLEAELFALAKSPDERLTAYQLASHVRREQMIAAASKEVAETSWGKEISQNARAAVVRYMMEIGADPLRHCYVLGGNIYLNAAFYQELCAANPKFLRAETDWVMDDDRASTEERARRLALRIQYGVPEKAPGAAIVTLYYEGRGPFIGVNWAGVRTKADGSTADPIGKAEPTKTAETRAYRRAALKAEPAWFKRHPGLQQAEQILAEGRQIPDDPRLPPAPVAQEAAPPIAPIAPPDA